MLALGPYDVDYMKVEGWLHVATAWIIENWDDVAVNGKSLKLLNKY